jgi:hypothetical protein
MKKLLQGIFFVLSVCAMQSARAMDYHFAMVKTMHDTIRSGSLNEADQKKAINELIDYVNALPTEDSVVLFRQTPEQCWQPMKILQGVEEPDRVRIWGFQETQVLRLLANKKAEERRAQKNKCCFIQ